MNRRTFIGTLSGAAALALAGGSFEVEGCSALDDLEVMLPLRLPHSMASLRSSTQFQAPHWRLRSGRSTVLWTAILRPLTIPARHYGPQGACCRVMSALNSLAPAPGPVSLSTFVGGLPEDIQNLSRPDQPDYRNGYAHRWAARRGPAALSACAATVTPPKTKRLHRRLQRDSWPATED